MTRKYKYEFKNKDALRKAILWATEMKHIPKPKFSEEELQRGLELSKLVCRQRQDVPITPIMKHMLEYFGDATGEDWTLKVDTPETKAEKWLNTTIKTILDEQFPGGDSYDHDVPMDSVLHYNVDCRRNFKTNMRQIQPGQEEERKQIAAKFRQPIDGGPLFCEMLRDPIFQLAIDTVERFIPDVNASHDFSETSAPFETKWSNVGKPYYRNAKLIDPATGKRYGDMSMDIAKKLDFKTCYNFNACTFFARNQIKGRLIIAQSRPLNIFLNRLEANEIEALKYKCPYFAGYRDDTELKKVLITMLEDAERLGLHAQNWDQSKFDLHINPAWVALIGTLRWLHSGNALGKELCKIRALTSMHSWALDGMSGELVEIWGRKFSGEIDTNQGDGWTESIAMTKAHMELDPDYSKIIRAVLYYLLVMGDDSLMLYNPQRYDPKKFSDIMNKMGFELNLDKGEFGIFFLQYRLFRENNNYIMVYPWTRVLRSMLFTEETKGLGPGGWLLAQYQQLSKLREYPKALDALVSILLPFDKYKFGADMTVQQIIDMVKAEDSQAVAKDPKRGETTSTKLYDGDPSKARMFDSDGQVSHAWLTDIHQVIADSVHRVKPVIKTGISSQ